MKTGGSDLIAGAALLVLIPLLLLWQSSNTSPGTGPGKSEYNADQFGGVLTQFLYEGEAEALDPFCDYALIRERNPALAEAWLEDVVRRCGESFHTRLTRGRLLAFRGDREGARREFAAAGACVPDDKARERLDKFMREAGL